MMRPVADARLSMPDQRGRRLLVAVLACGLMLRLANYAKCRSLWLDEASLALNIATRSYGQLLEQLDYNQAAPLLFLWAERLAVQLGGVNEWSLRLFPLVSGLATLLLLSRLAYSLLPARAALLATALAAFSPALIVYSVELKPYSLDALLGVVLLMLGVRILEHPDSRRAWVALVATGIVGLFGSMGAPLVLAGTGLGLLSSRAVWSSRTAGRWLTASALAFGGVLTLLYLTFYRTADSAYMHTVWRANFLSPAIPAVLGRAWAALREIVWSSLLGGVTNWGLTGIREVLVNGGTLIILCCAALGVPGLARSRGRPIAILILGSSAMTLAASALQRYPVSLRLVLFAVPSLILLAATGIIRLTSSFGGRRGDRLLVLIGFLFVARAAAYDIVALLITERNEDGRTVIRDLERHHRRGEPVYVYSRGLVVWAFYTTDWQEPDRARLDWFRDRGGLNGPAFENAPSRGRPVAADEGQGLVYKYRDRPELIGLSTGVQWLALAGFSRPGPDPGWAPREAARIREIAHPSAWIFITHPVDTSHEDLLAQLDALGGRVVYRRIEWGAAVFQVWFD